MGLSNAATTNTVNKQPENHNIQTPPEAQNGLLYAIFGPNFLMVFLSRIVNMISVMLLFMSLLLLYTKYKIDKLKNADDSTSLPFDILEPGDFKRTTYFIDPHLKQTIKEGQESLDKIKSFNQNENDENIYKLREELNRKRLILISGYPGTGKSFTTQAIIGDFPPKYRIINITPSSLDSKFVGESAKLLSSIFKYIEKERTSEKEEKEFIVLFDECDSLIEIPGCGMSSLVNQFLISAGGDDKIKRLPFLCIFLTNLSETIMTDRTHRRFTHVTPDFMRKNTLKTLLKNFLNIKKIPDLKKEQKDNFYDVFDGCPIQYPLDFLNEIYQTKSNSKIKSLDIQKFASKIAYFKIKMSDLKTRMAEEAIEKEILAKIKEQQHNIDI
ncbi:Spastin [Cucumispora dikerogammari]|nr:Spastin [Cucumispora dikerogammari]